MFFINVFEHVINLNLEIALHIKQQLSFVFVCVKQQVAKVVFYKRLDLIKGLSSYKGCCL